MVNSNRNLWWGIGIVVTILIITYILALSGGNSKNETIKIGFVGPLTGEISFIGQNNKAAVELAVEEINSQGGIDEKMIEIIYEDGKCNARDAANAGNKLINVDEVSYIIGGLCSGETLAIAPLAEEKQIIVISPGSSSPDITTAGDYIFRDYIDDNDAGKVLARKAYGNGHRKVALLWSLNDQSQGLSDVFANEFTSLGGEITLKESFAQGTNDLRSVVSKVKFSDADTTVIFGYTTETITFFRQREELGLDLPVYGTDLFTDPELIDILGEMLDGTKYVITKGFVSDEFKAKMQVKTGDNDVQLGSPQAYDAVYILAQAIEEASDNPTEVKDWLYNMPSYDGESGVIEFDENGDLVFSEFELWQIQDSNPVLIE